MRTALSVLHSMAEKGNEYVKARYSLLMNLRASMQIRATPYSGDIGTSSKGSIFSLPTDTPDYEEIMNQEALSTIPTSSQSLEEMSFNLDDEDNSRLWEEISGNIDIDMETDWIENTMRRDNHLSTAR